MAHSYEAEYAPDIPVPADVVLFFENFYRISDVPGNHDQYVAQFARDATFVLASKRAQGSQEIMTTRVGMWSAVVSRQHSIHKIFPFSSQSAEFMLYGSVALGLRNGAGVDVDWAARAVIVKSDDGKWRFKHYQVYMDTAAVASQSR